jgi:hypothetical protein
VYQFFVVPVVSVRSPDELIDLKERREKNGKVEGTGIHTLSIDLYPTSFLSIQTTNEGKARLTSRKNE